MLFEAGASLEAVLGGNSQTPDGELLLGIKRVLAKHENAQRVERAMRAKREHSKRGLFIAGKPPYGYDYLPRDAWRPGETNLTIIPERAEIVRRIFDLYVSGSSLREIIRILTAERVPTSVNGAQWRAASVRHILSNPAYIGAATFAKRTTSSRNGKYKMTINDNWTTVPCPAIVDPVTFDRAQHVAEYNRQNRRNRPRRFSMLRGLLFCSECGHTYQCVRDHPLYAHRRAALGCVDKHVDAAKIEGQVWAWVVEKLSDPATICEALGVTDNAIEATYEKRLTLLGKYEHQVDDLAGERVNLARLVSKGTISEDDYHKALAELEGEIEDTQAMREQISRELAAAPSPQQVAAVLGRISEILRVIFDGARVELSREEKRGILLELNQALDLVYVRQPNGDIRARGRYLEPGQGVLLSTATRPCARQA